MRIEANSKLVMIGDSITDAGRTRPIAEGLFDPLGRGYVTMIDALLGACCPELNIRVVNMGCGGHTVRDLKARWQTDVLDLKPDWLSIMIGINEVWRQFDLPLQTETHVGLEEYEQTLNELVVKTLPSLKGLILMTPYFLEPNRKDPMRVRMSDYGLAVRRVAHEHRCVYIDTQMAFDQFLKYRHPAALAWDRIHPNQVGHMVLARAFLQALGFRWY